MFSVQRSQRLITGLLAVWLLSACQSVSAPAGLTLPTASRAATTPLASATPSPTLTPTVTPTVTLTPTAAQPPLSTPIACEETHGRIEIFYIDTDLLTDPLAVHVYLPPCFNPSPAQRYPVLYMLHGQGYRGDQWDRLGIDEAADALISSGETPAFFIFMPYEVDSLAYPGEANYDQVIVETLLPWAEANYPICRERACRAVGGLSRGGGWALRLGFKYWQVFGAVGGHSPTPFGADVESYPAWYEKIPSGEIPRLYMDIGEKDRYLNPATAFKDWLINLNIPVEWHLNPGTHNEGYWSIHVREYLRWYAEGF
jgi:enterochelin esterase-like enzyme